jgi:hypothetical protein
MKEKFEPVLKKLCEISQKEDYDGETGSEYLASFFDKDTDSFCRFIGFVTAEVKRKNISKPVAVDILADMAIVGMLLGLRDGYDEAKRFYQARREVSA